MLAIFATILLVALGLIVLFWVGTIWAQGYFYDSPADGLHWRAPAAAGVIAVFLFLWMLIEYRRPESTDTFTRFTREEKQEYDRFISVRKTEDGEQEIVFERRGAGGQSEFRNDKNQRWERSMSGMMVAIILEEKVTEGGEEKTVRRKFNAEIEGGKFTPRIVRGMQQRLRYIEEDGDRIIEEDRIGLATSKPRWRLFVNLFLNAFHLLLWFLAMWLLLRFQWPHALAFSFVLWMAVSLILVPYVLDRAREKAPKPAKTTSTAMTVPNFGTARAPSIS